MGYAFVFAPCLVCKREFSMNPVRVPSFRWNGVKEPICKSCMDVINEARVEKGLEPFSIHPDAYDACDEMELG